MDIKLILPAKELSIKQNALLNKVNVILEQFQSEKKYRILYLLKICQALILHFKYKNQAFQMDVLLFHKKGKY